MKFTMFIENIFLKINFKGKNMNFLNKNNKQ